MKKLLLAGAAIGGLLAFRKKAAAANEADLWHEATTAGGTRPVPAPPAVPSPGTTTPPG